MTVFYRRMPRFGYFRARSLEEALGALDETTPVGHQVYAGGTDLLPKLKARSIRAPLRVIDLKGIADLDYIRWDPDTGLRIGALATTRDVAATRLVSEKYPALAQGARDMGSNQLQNRGTIVGNICNASTSADSAPALLVHDAKVICVGTSGERAIDIAEFFADAGKTVLRAGELVKEIRIPPPQPQERGTYIKLTARGKMDLGLVGVAVSGIVEGGVVRKLRMGLGSAAPIPVRASEAEAALMGREFCAEAIDECAAVAARHARTRTSHRASAEYRRMMIDVLARRALAQIAR